MSNADIAFAVLVVFDCAAIAGLAYAWWLLRGVRALHVHALKLHDEAEFHRDTILGILRELEQQKEAAG